MKMKISSFHVGKATIRIANDGGLWKTSVNGDVWTPGLEDLGDAIQHALDSLKPNEILGR